MKKPIKINWLNTIFLILTPILGIAGTVLLSVYGLVQWPTWLLMGILSVIGGLTITMGYHRCFSHVSYRLAWPVRLFFALFGAASFQGSILEWCTDHRNHHRYTDTDRDPYDIKKGFWFAHIGWLFTLDTSKRDFSNVEDLAKDPIIRLQHRYYPLLAALMGFGLPTAIAALWGNALAGFVVAGLFRTFVNHHLTFCINSVCHLFGSRPYSEQQSARDNWFTALFTFGEGYHNFHHQFPLDYRNAIRFYQFDPAKWMINVLAWVGLASDLKRVEDHRILRYKIRLQEKTMLAQAEQWVQPMVEKLQELLVRLETLEKQYKQYKAEQMEKPLIKNTRVMMKQAKRELNDAMTVWASLVRKNMKNAAV